MENNLFPLFFILFIVFSMPSLVILINNLDIRSKNKDRLKCLEALAILKIRYVYFNHINFRTGIIVISNGSTYVIKFNKDYAFSFIGDLSLKELTSTSDLETLVFNKIKNEISLTKEEVPFFYKE